MSHEPIVEMLQSITESNLESVQKLILLYYWCKWITEHTDIIDYDTLRNMAIAISNFPSSKVRSTALVFVQSILRSSLQLRQRIIDFRSICCGEATAT